METLTLGRRTTDRILGEVLTQIVSQLRGSMNATDFKTEALFRAASRPEPKEEVIPVKPAKVVTERRKRRTKMELRNAMHRAIAQVQQEHRDWKNNRVMRRARSLVRTCQVI